MQLLLRMIFMHIKEEMEDWTKKRRLVVIGGGGWVSLCLYINYHINLSELNY